MRGQLLVFNVCPHLGPLRLTCENLPLLQPLPPHLHPPMPSTVLQGGAFKKKAEPGDVKMILLNINLLMS